MSKILLSILLLAISSFALTLDQIRTDLKKSAMAQDSTEMQIRATVNSKAGKQTVSIYMVKKGESRIYIEMKGPFMNQRSIVNGSRMKVIDLNTNKFQIHPYNGEALAADSYAKFNPLDSGDWQEPEFVSENLYKINGSKGVLYYDSKKKHIEKLENSNETSSTLTTFTYNAENNLKIIEVSVLASGAETKITTEVLALRSSKKFPDKLFEF